MRACRGSMWAVVVLAAGIWAASAVAGPAGTAREILDTAGVKGGLIVHLGCGDGSLTAALRAGESYMVCGFDADAARIARARQTITAAGLYGPVTAERITAGRLPLVDNLANLVVVEDAGGVPMSEVFRVLCPDGVALVRAGGRWVRKVKPRPAELDEWTHYMHDATGNAVSTDTVVGPPRRLQWVAGPRWTRHHEHMSSFSALVAAKGRIFYILDEGSRVSIQLPPHWKLIARDAFNGTLLWKRDISRWYTHLWPLKSGPAFLPRRLVAVGDVVYVTLGLDQPLVALDAATGRTLRTYGQTKATEEILYSDGVLLLLVDPRPQKPDRYTWIHPVCWAEDGRVDKLRPWDQQPRKLLAVEAGTGRTLWQTRAVVAPVTLAADGKRVAFHDGEKVVCLDQRTGRRLWASQPEQMRLPLPTCYAPTLVISDGVVLFAGGRGKMSGFDAATGRKLWTGQHYRAGHRSPEDLLVIEGLAWTGRLAGRPADNMWTGYDIRTGQVKRQFKPDIESYWFHHRCHRSKATVRYLMPSRTGIEYVDWRAEKWDRNHWVRGACVYGVMPANGLTYAPQHPCACYIETKLNGFNALAPAAAKPLEKPAESARLEKGPAYAAKADRPASGSGSAGEDWPTFRHDPARSGCSKTVVAPRVAQAWRTKLGGRLSSVTVADGRCYVAAVDAHTVYALDAADGKVLWRFTAGGRVDSPPTLWRGRAIFGCADGYVYCLRASDGALAWRYLAAPADRRTVAFDRIESVWPVHGSVLIREGVIYCIAGRSAFLDGGMRLCRIDAATGRLLSETLLDEHIPDTGKNLQFAMRGLNMPPALPDVLSCDEDFVYMRSQKFTFDGRRTEVVPAESASDQTGRGVHLFSTVGFLDGSWFHRSYMLYGQKVLNGCNWWFRAGRYAPAGRLLVFDDEAVYGYGRLPHLFVWSPALEYRLYAARRDVQPTSIERVSAATRRMEKTNRRWIFNRETTGALKPRELSAADTRWVKNRPPLFARAMALAGRTLFLVGPPDVLDEEAAISRRWDADVQQQLREQDAALAGQRGALLWAVSAADGNRLHELKLDAAPVWDGLAAARGRLYLAATDGTVRCFAPQR